MKFLKIELATLICHIGDFFNEKYRFFQKLKKKEKKRKKEKVEMPEKGREMILISLVPLNCPRFSYLITQFF